MQVITKNPVHSLVCTSQQTSFLEYSTQIKTGNLSLLWEIEL